jgi:hypothetical protein
MTTRFFIRLIYRLSLANVKPDHLGIDEGER